MDIKTDSRFLTAEEVLFIFQEEHRLFSIFDEEADTGIELSMTTNIITWYDAGNLLQGKELGEYLNRLFDIHISPSEWLACLEPESTKQLKDVCELIAQHAQIDILKPIQVFGRQCLPASIFYYIKNRLSKEGVDVRDLTPSSLLEPYLKNPQGVLFRILMKNFPGSIPEIKLTETLYHKLFIYFRTGFIITLLCALVWHPLWVISLFLYIATHICYYKNKKEVNNKNGMIYIPGIQTFRDLIEEIIEKRNYLAIETN